MEENKEILLDLLKQCTKKQQFKFKRLYSNKQLYLSIEDIVKNMENPDVNWAIEQASRTIKKNEDKIELKLKKLIGNLK